jgi:hypothetical protein
VKGWWEVTRFLVTLRFALGLFVWLVAVCIVFPAQFLAHCAELLGDLGLDLMDYSADDARDAEAKDR